MGMMRLIDCGDLHLKPAASDYDIDAMDVPGDFDAAVILGDLTRRAGSDDVRLARRFLQKFEGKAPLIYVPGNHDHSPTENRAVEPFQISSPDMEVSTN